MTDTAPDVNGLINLLNALAIDFECDDNIYAEETCDKAAAALRTLQEENEALADALRGLLKAYENAFDWTSELPPETAEAERIANEVLEALTSSKPEQAVPSGRKRNRYECPTCGGSGEIAPDAECPDCDGTGACVPAAPTAGGGDA